MQPDDTNVQTPKVSPEKWLDNALKAATLAVSRFPRELWIQIEPSIFIARSRLPISSNQRDTLKKEIVQARVLTARGNSIYFLPEEGEGKHPDAVVDGNIIEFKTITGTVDRIRENYKNARLKARRVFLKIDSNLTQEAVLSKLIDQVRKGKYSGGKIIVHFTYTGKTYFWEEDRLK